MKKRAKLYIRLNLLSLFFVVVSFISLTLAWFVYSGLSTVKTEVDVKAWYIELEQDGKVISNDIVISLDDIYPGMEPIEEEITIKNLGDSNAQVKYKIVSARILDKEKDNYVTDDKLTSEYVEDRIAHDYPFHINMELSKKFITAKTDETTFKVSISWPLDSGDEILYDTALNLRCYEESETCIKINADEFDSVWGNNAYNFKLEQQKKKNNDSAYQIQASIKLDIQLTAEQYIETPEASDIPYRLGNEILYDTALNLRCYEEKGTCIRTNVIDVNNIISDETVTLLPKVNNIIFDETVTFEEIKSLHSSLVEDWNVKTELLTLENVLNVISKDIKNSVLVRPNISDLIIGNLKYENRLETVVQQVVGSGGYFKFLNKFSYFDSDECYWLSDEYNSENGFVISQNEETGTLKIYPNPKSSKCKVIPVIEAEKINLK